MMVFLLFSILIRSLQEMPKIQLIIFFSLNFLWNLRIGIKIYIKLDYVSGDKIKNIWFWKCADSILEVQKQVVLHQEWKIHKNAFSIPSKSVILTRPFLAFPCCGQVSLLHFTMQGITKSVSKIRIQKNHVSTKIILGRTWKV